MNIPQQLKDKIYSGDNLMGISDVRYLPRWIILMIDLCFIIIAIYLSKFIIEKLTYGIREVFFNNYIVLALISGSSILFMFLFRTYAGIIRHSTFIDLFKLFLATLSTMVFVGLITFSYYLVTGERMIIMSIPFLVLFFAVSFTLLFLFRLVVKEFFHIAREFRRSSMKKRILVLGIDETSVAIARAILENSNLPYHIVGFLTQRHDSKRASLLGKPIFNRDKLEKSSKEMLALDGVLISKERVSKEEMNEWVNLFLEKKLLILKAPSLQKLRSSDLGESIKNLQIEDLLNRRPIKIENKEVEQNLHQKTILITGGAGSIGSEIVRQVALFAPMLIVVLDQAETPLYDIEMEMTASFPAISFKFILGDISNRKRMEKLFSKYQFSMVYHAAAYKHVPVIEENPHEAIFVNLLGTRNLAILASRFHVHRFVMISTDKAVNPTNVMGASKRAAELYVQALQHTEENSTKFITTRFGNVLGSNGSVIPHFKKQIEKGGPVTITHPEITRYFMTIPEACDLVLQAGTMGNGGEVYVFDMGKPVKIVDLAHRMIKLSGLEPDVDISIVFTGLRPGEKLYEELLSNNCKTLPTHHDKIMISKDPSMVFRNVEEYFDEISEATKHCDEVEIVAILKKMIPEFISNNSIYEVLDK